MKIKSSGTKAFTCVKWVIGYNFDIDDCAESKFDTHKELIALIYWRLLKTPQLAT